MKSLNSVYNLKIKKKKVKQNSKKKVNENEEDSFKLKPSLETNNKIVEELELIRNNLLSTNDIYRVKAYNNVLKIINDNFSDKPIKNGEELQSFKGVGIKLVSKINEIFKNGFLEETINIKNNNSLKIIELFSSIYAIGPKNAYKFVNEKKIFSLEELEKRKDELQENGLPLLDNKMQLGLKYYENFLNRIPREEMIHHENFLIKQLETLILQYPETNIMIVGSYRRKKEDSGDVDILISNEKNKKEVFNSFIHLLKKNKYLIDDLAFGEKKYMGVCKLKNKEPRRVDILYTSPREYPFAQLYFTGSGNFNSLLRDYANSCGFRLNEYGLKHYDIKTKIIGEYVDNIFLNEEDIFKFLKIPYINPENREDYILQEEINKL
jgi:DNA polymerase/3'-5' exonuclease PolX